MGTLTARGVVVPLLTPLLPDEGLDRQAFEKLILHVVNGGVDGLFVLGTAGEFCRLPDTVAMHVVETALRCGGGQKPIYVGVSDCGAKKVVEKARVMEGMGADAFVLTLPIYYPARSPKEQRIFFEQVCEQVHRPVVLYNLPDIFGMDIDLGVIESLAKDRLIAGIKDSGGNIRYVSKLLDIRKEYPLSVLIGEERLILESLRMGADGAVPSLANVHPKLFRRLIDSVAAKELPLALRLQKTLDHINRTINGCTPTRLAPVYARKVLLEAMGIGSARMAQPSIALDESQKRAIVEAVAGIWAQADLG